MSIGKAQKESLIILGQRVKSIRNDKGLTLKELAHTIDKDPSQSID
jgi:hypothetical protein